MPKHEFNVPQVMQDALIEALGGAQKAKITMSEGMTQIIRNTYAEFLLGQNGVVKVEAAKAAPDKALIGQYMVTLAEVQKSEVEI